MRTTSVRRWAIAVWWAVALPAGARGQGAPDSVAVPTIAVLDFTSSAMRGAEEFVPWGKAIPDILITELQGNPRVQVLERERLRELLDEQELTRARAANPATLARLGTLLGARYMITGGLMVDRRDRLRIDVRAIEVATTKVVFSEQVRSTGEEVFDAVSAAAAKLSTGLRLAPEAASAPRRTSVRDQRRLIGMHARAILQQDLKNAASAAALYAEFVADPASAALPAHREKAETRMRVLQPGSR